MEVMRNGQDAIPGPAECFTGAVWMESAALGTEETQRLHVLRVRFSPGARSAWHSHPVGQILHVLDGTGRVQERGGPVQEIRAGDSVVTAPDVWHWHGAGPTTFMTHLAIQQADPQGSEANWGEHVTDAEYDAGPVGP